MPTTVLTLIQDFAEKMNLPTPTALVASTDKTNRQYKSILRELIADLCEYQWQQQTLRLEWLSTAGQDQGTLESIFGAGYYSLIPDCTWNDDRKMRVYGPVSNPVWQALQTLPNAGPEFQCWISGNHLYVSPELNAIENMSSIYKTQYGVLAVDGTTTKPRVTVDSDSLLFPDNVVMRGFEYKWRKQKGVPGWEDDYNDYIALVSRNIVKDGAVTLQLDVTHNGPRPGIVIPAGSWNV